MKTIHLNGKISYSFPEEWLVIKLIQKDGYKIDLITRIKELLESYPNYNTVQVNYYITEKECTREEALGHFLMRLYGGIEASYTSEDYSYSEWSEGTYHYTTLEIGGHNLKEELVDNEGKFLLLELNLKQTNP